MIQFKVSAPCRLSLFGEHVLKYGKEGLIAAIDLRTTLIFNELPPSQHGSLQLNFHGTELVQGSLEMFQKFYSDCKKDMTLLRERVLEFTDDSYKSDNHKIIIQTFYYLFVLIVFKENIEIKSFTMHLSTELTMDGELTCPESFIVCLAASLLHWSRLQKGAHDTFNRADLRKIQLYATCCEEMCPELSTVNVTACTFGSIVKYSIRDMYSTVLFGMLNMPILLVDSKQVQNLEAQTQQMTEIKDILPEIGDSIVDTLDIITDKAYDVFRQLNTYKDDDNSIETTRTMLHKELKTCILVNQNLLNAFNASHDSLNNICVIARKHEMYAKYTDIGNGRYAYVWCPRHADEPCKHMELISKELETHGFDVTETNLARNGVKIEMMT